MIVSKKTPIVRIKAEVLVAACDAQDVLDEFRDAFINSDCSQFRLSPPHIVGVEDDVDPDCMHTLYPGTFKED